MLPHLQAKNPLTDGFAGFIGNKPIHAKINVSQDKVSGVYYYDEYKTSIKLKAILMILLK